MSDYWGKRIFWLMFAVVAIPVLCGIGYLIWLVSPESAATREKRINAEIKQSIEDGWKRDDEFRQIIENARRRSE